MDVAKVANKTLVEVPAPQSDTNKKLFATPVRVSTEELFSRETRKGRSRCFIYTLLL